MKSFPTALGKEYTFQEPFCIHSEAENRSEEDSSLIYINGEGQAVNIDGKPIPPPEILLTINQLSKLPYPSVDSEDQYRRIIQQWQNSMLNVAHSVLLPIPMGVNYKRPAMPHVPTPQEKIEKSLENRTAAKAFNIKTTPLYPQNYMVMLDAVLNENQINEIEFEVKGPRGERIPVANHFRTVKPWSSQLIQQKPNPHLFKHYSDYQNAMYCWIQQISQSCVIPPSPQQLQSIIGIDLERHQVVRKNLKKNRVNRMSSSDFYSIVTITPSSFQDSDDEPGSILSDPSINQLSSFLTSDLMRIKSRVEPIQGLSDLSLRFLAGLKHVYFTNNIEAHKLQHEPKLAQQLISTNPPLPILYKEWSEFGVEKPIYHKMRAIAFVNEALASELSNSPQFSYIPELYNAKEIYTLCKTFKHPHLRLSLFEKILGQLSNSEIFEAIISDIQYLYEIYILFHEFTTQISDPPELVIEYKCDILLSDLYSKLINYYMLRQIYDYYKDRDKILGKALIAHLESLRTSIDQLLHQYQKIRSLLEGSVKEFPQLCSQIVFLMLSLENRFLSYLLQVDMRIIPIIMEISRSSPTDFRKLQLNIFRSLTMSTFIIQQLSLLNYNQNFLLYETSDEFLSFLSSILVQRLPKESISANVDWTLSFLTDILNHGGDRLSTTQCEFIYSISIFIQNRMWAYPQTKNWEIMLPQILSTILAFMVTTNETKTILSLLKSFRRLLWHPCATKFLRPKLIVDQMVPFLKNPATSVSGIRTIKVVVVNHPKFLDEIISKPKDLKVLGEAMFITSEDAYIELFKMIKLFTTMQWYSSYKNQFQQFLLASHFRIDAAKSKVEGKAQKKQREVFKDFVLYLKKAPHVNQMLNNIEKQLSSSSRK